MDEDEELAQLLAPEFGPNQVSIERSEDTVHARCGACRKAIHWSLSRGSWGCSSMACSRIYDMVPEEVGASILALPARSDLEPGTEIPFVGKQLTKWISTWTGIGNTDLDVVVTAP